MVIVVARQALNGLIGWQVELLADCLCGDVVDDDATRARLENGAEDDLLGVAGSEGDGGGTRTGRERRSSLMRRERNAAC